jgi:hypothetical protein
MGISSATHRANAHKGRSSSDLISSSLLPFEKDAIKTHDARRKFYSHFSFIKLLRIIADISLYAGKGIFVSGRIHSCWEAFPSKINLVHPLKREISATDVEVSYALGLAVFSRNIHYLSTRKA